jgi:hypothetical protein
MPREVIKSTFIDWISITHKQRGDNLPEVMDRTHILSNGRNGYTESKLYLSGVIELMNPTRPDMGIHIIYSGKTLERVSQQTGMSRDDILSHHIGMGGKPSRIDYAIDIQSSGLDLDEIWENLEQKKAKTKSSHSRSQSGHGQGYTIYIGSRKTRKKMLRIYDKALEQRFDGVDYKRIELETRQDVAKNMCAMYVESNYSTDCIESAILGVCNFPEVGIWDYVFQCEPSKIPVAKSGNGDTETWLLKQVAPAMAKVLAYDPSFKERFEHSVDFYRYKYIVEEHNNI